MHSLLSFLARVEEVIVCLLLVGMIVLACLQILLRDLFAGGLAWADPLLRYMVLWIGLLGAAIATKRDKHIGIDIASHLLPKEVLLWLRVVIQFFSSLVCVVLTYAAYRFVHDELSYGGGQVVLGLPSWLLTSIFPFVFGLMSIRFFACFVYSLLFALGRAKPTVLEGR